jgi:hypothetical protein
MQFRNRHLLSAHGAARPGRDVFTALVLKGVLLLALYLLFFAPNHRMPSDAAATAQALIGTSAPKDNP